MSSVWKLPTNERKLCQSYTASEGNVWTRRFTPIYLYYGHFSIGYAKRIWKNEI
ncbi:unnamed protein product [Larinioides sclopetarius]|uniref:Uncharacterized protein n=1 Tax=Larinioides sclopetarius TaxID=280406 RepID=A0AAV2AUG0_9ARAC